MGSSICLDCPPGKYSNISGTVLYKDCPLNTEQSGDKTKCECSSGFYDLIDDKCVECDAVSFICPKGTLLANVLVKADYCRGFE